MVKGRVILGSSINRNYVKYDYNIQFLRKVQKALLIHGSSNEEDCGNVGGIKQRSILLKGSLTERVGCSACIYVLHVVLILYTYLSFRNNPIPSLSLFIFSYITSGFNFLGSQMQFCKTILSQKMNIYSHDCKLNEKFRHLTMHKIGRDMSF